MGGEVARGEEGRQVLAEKAVVGRARKPERAERADGGREGHIRGSGCAQGSMLGSTVYTWEPEGHLQLGWAVHQGYGHANGGGAGVGSHPALQVQTTEGGHLNKQRLQVASHHDVCVVPAVCIRQGLVRLGAVAAGADMHGCDTSVTMSK